MLLNWEKEEAAALSHQDRPVGSGRAASDLGPWEGWDWGSAPWGARSLPSWDLGGDKHDPFFPVGHLGSPRPSLGPVAMVTASDFNHKQKWITVPTISLTLRSSGCLEFSKMKMPTHLL